MMEYRDGMFQVVLGEYALFEVQKAFLAHVKQSPDLPTPSDIVRLIEEDRKYRLVEKPDIETLKRYKARGLPLTPAQQMALEAYE
jgi:hypothetical protein